MFHVSLHWPQPCAECSRQTGRPQPATSAIAIAMWAGTGQRRYVNRQFCTGRDATPRHALGACGGDSGQPARRRGLAEGAEGADGDGWRWVLMPSAERGVVACGGQGGSMAAWQHGRIAGSKGARRRRGSVSSGAAAARHQSEIGRGILEGGGASQHCAGLGHGRHGGIEAWGHGGLEGRWKPVGAVQSRHTFTFTARTSKALVQLKAVAGEHGRVLVC
jgi:hypothetical protein